MSHGFPFRWVLPVAQFLLCLVILWPARNWILFQVRGSVRAYTPTKSQDYEFARTTIILTTPSSDLPKGTKPEPTQKSTPTPSAQPRDISGNLAPGTVQVINIPGLSPQEMEREEKAAKDTDLRLSAPLILDSPVLLAQVPYMLLTARKEWVPRGMIPEVWRALSWPIFAIAFWWIMGRGIEALSAARRSVLLPRITRIETILAAVLFCVGVIAAIGIISSTPADRGDSQFMALLAGGALWGVLASMTLAARFLQWRIRRHHVTENP
jgi:hypothetical protein